MTLQHECLKPYGPLIPVTWLHLPRKQTNTDTFTAPFVEPQCSVYAHSFHFWRQPKLTNVTWASSWGLGGITPAIYQQRQVSLSPCCLYYSGNYHWTTAGMMTVLSCVKRCKFIRKLTGEDEAKRLKRHCLWGLSGVSSVAVVTRVRRGRLRNRGSIPSRNKRSYHSVQTRPWDPPALLPLHWVPRGLLPANKATWA